MPIATTGRPSPAETTTRCRSRRAVSSPVAAPPSCAGGRGGSGSVAAWAASSPAATRSCGAAPPPRAARALPGRGPAAVRRGPRRLGQRRGVAGLLDRRDQVLRRDVAGVAAPRLLRGVVDRGGVAVEVVAALLVCRG